MATKAKTTKGVRLLRGDGAVGTEAFALIAEVKSFNGPTESTAQIDATSFDSAGKEYIAGLSDTGEVSFDFNFVGSDEEQQGLREDLRAGVLRNFELEFNDHATAKTKFAFAALVTSLSVQGGTDAIIEGSCTLKLSGLPTVAYATAA